MLARTNAAVYICQPTDAHSACLPLPSSCPATTRCSSWRWQAFERQNDQLTLQLNALEHSLQTEGAERAATMQEHAPPGQQPRNRAPPLQLLGML